MASAYTPHDALGKGLALRNLAALLLLVIASLVVSCGGKDEGGGPTIAWTFQTTFDDSNFPDRRPGEHWAQSDGLGDEEVGKTGDGISGYGGWTTVAGSEDRIITAANFPGGRGGKGLRHYRGDGSNDNGGGLEIDAPSPVTEMWVRFYMRYSMGFAWDGDPVYTKDHYWQGTQGYLVFGIQGSGWGLHYSESGNYASTRTWSQSQGGATGDGQWHCYEYHVKANGAASTIEVWIDGVNYLSITNADLGTAGWSWFVLGSNQATPTGCTPDCYTDYDDIAISTSSSIGCDAS